MLISLFKKLFVTVALLLSVSACGFVAINSEGQTNGVSNVIVKKISIDFEERYYPIEQKRAYDYLKRQLRESFPEDQEHYIVTFKNFSQRSAGIRIDNDGNFQTFKMYVGISYEIREVGKKEVLYSEELEVNSNYNITDSIYITEVIEREAMRDLINTLVGRINASLLLAIKSI